jgi:hypothetical protein
MFRIVLILFFPFLFSCDNDSSTENKAIIPIEKETEFSQFEDGDIIFQTSKSEQSKAIQLATHSKYSHVGVIYFNPEDQNLYVFEAVQTVRITPLKEWISKGENSRYTVKRLINSKTFFTPKVKQNLKIFAKIYSNKNYDPYFGWSDDKIYCSELVWKLFNNATSIKLGELQELQEFDLSNPIVVTKLSERYGENIPLNEKVISPGAIYNSDLLETIFEN